MKIELLYFEGCPSHAVLLPELRELLDRNGIHDEIELRRVETPEDAERERFLGSPSLRIEGHDIEPGADSRRDYGFKCRLYRTPEGTSGVPPAEWITAALGLAREGAR
jgi:hypothetical protein